MTLVEMLDSHDWYFEMADDHRYWKAGQNEEIDILGEMKKYRDLPFEERKAMVKSEKNDWYKCINSESCGGFYRGVFLKFFTPEEIEQLKG